MTLLRTPYSLFPWLVGLSVLLVIHRSARSDDATDWANWQAQAQKEREQAERDRQERENWQNQIAKDQREREEWDKQQAQAQRDREQAEKDRQEREAWQNQIAKDQREREEWYNQQAQAQKEREEWDKQQAQAQREAEQAQKERDLNEYLNQIWKQGDDLRKWAEEKARQRQEEINQAPPAPAAPQPGAVLLNPLAAAPPLPAPPPPGPAAKQPNTHTITIYNGPHATRTTFVKQPDGSWHGAMP